MQDSRSRGCRGQVNREKGLSGQAAEREGASERSQESLLRSRRIENMCGMDSVVSSGQTQACDNDEMQGSCDEIGKLQGHEGIRAIRCS